MKFTLQVPDLYSQRIDTYLVEEISKRLPGLPVTRSQVHKLFEKQKIVTTTGEVYKKNHQLKSGEIIEIDLTDLINEQKSGLPVYNYPLTVVYEDSEIIVIDKPAGLMVHPGAGNKDKTLVNALIHYLGDETFLANHSIDLKSESSEEDPEEDLPDSTFRLPAANRPGIVHRLDKDTTGLIVVAKTLLAHQKLIEQFSNREVTKLYKALCLSTPKKKSKIDSSTHGTIDLAIGRHPNKRTMMKIDGIAARSAVTDWTIIKKFDYATLLELKIKTGRTHQIRVHLDALGSPVIGDQVYGNFSSLPKELKTEAEKFGRQALHACFLEFRHPGTGKIVSLKSEIPADFQALISAFEKFTR